MYTHDGATWKLKLINSEEDLTNLQDNWFVLCAKNYSKTGDKLANDQLADFLTEHKILFLLWAIELYAIV